MSKRDVIASVLTEQKCTPAVALVIGDSDSDYAAAQAMGVEFLLRRTALNRNLQRQHLGLQCEDFMHE